MSRVTKAMILADNKRINRFNSDLMKEVEQLKKMNQFLLRKDFDVDAFCRMHAEGITAIAHAMTDLRVLIQKLH